MLWPHHLLNMASMCRGISFPKCLLWNSLLSYLEFGSKPAYLGFHCGSWLLMLIYVYGFCGWYICLKWKRFSVLEMQGFVAIEQYSVLTSWLNPSSYVDLVVTVNLILPATEIVSGFHQGPLQAVIYSWASRSGSCRQMLLVYIIKALLRTINLTALEGRVRTFWGHPAGTSEYSPKERRLIKF